MGEKAWSVSTATWDPTRKRRAWLKRADIAAIGGLNRFRGEIHDHWWPEWSVSITSTCEVTVFRGVSGKTNAKNATFVDLLKSGSVITVRSFLPSMCKASDCPRMRYPSASS